MSIRKWGTIPYTASGRRDLGSDLTIDIQIDLCDEEKARRKKSFVKKLICSADGRFRFDLLSILL